MKGYLPECLLNFIALLGWNPKNNQEIMSMEEMIERFELTDIHKSGALLDPVKLNWMNSEYIKKMELGLLHERLVEYLKVYAPEFYTEVFSQAEYDFNAKIIRELQSRMRKFDEYIELTGSLYGEAPMRRDLLVNAKMKIESDEAAIASLQFVLTYIEHGDYTTLDSLKAPILEAIALSGQKNGQVLWPLRIALSGEEFSPGAFEIAFILGREKSRERIKKYLENHA